MTILSDLTSRKTNPSPPSLVTSASTSRVSVREGDDAFLLVLKGPGSGPILDISWAKGSRQLVGERYRVGENNNSVHLTLQGITREDEGEYTVTAKNIAGESRSAVYLRIKDDPYDDDDAPIFLRRLNDLAVKVGTRTRFLVEIRSSSDVQVIWNRNDIPIPEEERFHLLHEGNFFCLDVAPVTVDDGGRWSCVAENRTSRSSCSCRLSVLVPKAYKAPEFLEELKAVLTDQGTVSLECKVVGVPTPVLKWYKDGKEIKPGDMFALTANPDDPTSLGMYTCEATNCMGKAFSSSRVHVSGKGSREGSLLPADHHFAIGPPPIFSKELKNERVRIGTAITLECQVTVPPWPKSINWYNKEGKIEPNEKYHIMEDGLGGYSIEIYPLDVSDEGEWKCVASSDTGVISISKCNLDMTYPKNYRKPKFLESLKAILTEEGLVSFECKVVGFPTPQLQWFKDGQELRPGDVYQLTGTNSLGSYSCIARNCMGEARSTAELTVEDIQSQLNEEEKLHLFSKNQPPRFIRGLKSCEAKINEDFRFVVQVTLSPEANIAWYRDDLKIENDERYSIVRENVGVCYLNIKQLEVGDQAEWKCVASNDFGQSITTGFLKLSIPKHYKKPKFLECLRAILSEEGAVNLECKVIGVPQPVLKWYKDGKELNPGDIHRIISGQDGKCCLGTYTCEARNCMGSVSSSASLLGFEDRKAIKELPRYVPEPLYPLAKNTSLSTIHEERTSQLYDTPGEHSITMDERGDVSFSFDGKEVSISLYETPDLTEEEALQVVEMYAEELSEHISEQNVVELPPMRFTKESSKSGPLLMEAVVIEVSEDYFSTAEDDLRTEADFEDVSMAEEGAHSIASPEAGNEAFFEKINSDFLEKALTSLSGKEQGSRKRSSSDSFKSLSSPKKGSVKGSHDEVTSGEDAKSDTYVSVKGSSGKKKSRSRSASMEKKNRSFDETIEDGMVVVSPKKGSISRSSSRGSDDVVKKKGRKSRSQSRETIENVMKKGSSRSASESLDETIVDKAVKKRGSRSRSQSGESDGTETLVATKKKKKKVDVGVDKPKKKEEGRINTSRQSSTEKEKKRKSSASSIDSVGKEEDIKSKSASSLDSEKPEALSKKKKIRSRSTSADQPKEEKERRQSLEKIKKKLSEDEKELQPSLLKEENRKKLDYEAMKCSLKEIRETMTAVEGQIVQTKKDKESEAEVLRKTLQEIQKGLQTVEEQVNLQEPSEITEEIVHSFVKPVQDFEVGLKLTTEQKSPEEALHMFSLVSNKLQHQLKAVTSKVTDVAGGFFSLAVETLTKPLEDVSKLLSETKMSQHVESLTSVELLQNLAQPVQELQEALETAKELGVQKSEVLASLTEPIKSLQTAITIVEQKALIDADEDDSVSEKILKKVSLPLAKISHSLEVIENKVKTKDVKELPIQNLEILEELSEPVRDLHRGLAEVVQDVLFCPQKGEDKHISVLKDLAQSVTEVLENLNKSEAEESVTQEQKRLIFSPLEKPLSELRDTVAVVKEILSPENVKQVPPEVVKSNVMQVFSRPLQNLEHCLRAIETDLNQLPMDFGIQVNKENILEIVKDMEKGVVHMRESEEPVTKIFSVLLSPLQDLKANLSEKKKIRHPLSKSSSSLGKSLELIKQGSEENKAEIEEVKISLSVLRPLEKPLQDVEEGFGLLEQHILLKEKISQREKPIFEGQLQMLLEILSQSFEVFQEKWMTIESNKEENVAVLEANALLELVKELKNGTETIEDNLIELETISPKTKEIIKANVCSNLKKLKMSIGEVERLIVQESLQVVPELKSLKADITKVEETISFLKTQMPESKNILEKIKQPIVSIQANLENARDDEGKERAKPILDEMIRKVLTEFNTELDKVERTLSTGDITQNPIITQLKELKKNVREQLVVDATLAAVPSFRNFLQKFIKELNAMQTQPAREKLPQSDMLADVIRLIEENAATIETPESYQLEIAQPLVQPLVKLQAKLQEVKLSSNQMADQSSINVLQNLIKPLTDLKKGLKEVTITLRESMDEFTAVPAIAVLATSLTEMQKGVAAVQQQTALRIDDDGMPEHSEPKVLETLKKPIQDLQECLAKVQEKILESKHGAIIQNICDLQEETAYALKENLKPEVAEALVLLEESIKTGEDIRGAVAKVKEEIKNGTPKEKTLLKLRSQLDTIEQELNAADVEMKLPLKKKEKSEIDTMKTALEELHHGIENSVGTSDDENHNLKELVAPLLELGKILEKIETEKDIIGSSDVTKSLAKVSQCLENLEQKISTKEKGKPNIISNSIANIKAHVAEIKEMTTAHTTKAASLPKLCKLIKALTVEFHELREAITVAEETTSEDVSVTAEQSILKRIIQPIQTIQNKLYEMKEEVKYKSEGSLEAYLLDILTKPLHQLQAAVTVIQQQALETSQAMPPFEAFEEIAKPVFELHRGLAQIKQSIAQSSTTKPKAEEIENAVIKPILALFKEISMHQEQLEPDVVSITSKTDLSLLKTLAKPAAELQKMIAVVQKYETMEPGVEPIPSLRESAFATPLQTLSHGLQQLQTVILEASTMTECVPALEAVAKPVQELQLLFAGIQSHDYVKGESTSPGAELQLMEKLAKPIQNLANGLLIVQQEFDESRVVSLSISKIEPSSLLTTLIKPDDLEKMIAVVQQCQLMEPQAELTSVSQESTLAQPLQSLRHGLEELQNIVLEGITAANCVETLKAIAKPVRELQHSFAAMQSHEYIQDENAIPANDLKIMEKLAKPIQDLATGLLVVQQELQVSGAISFTESKVEPSSLLITSIKEDELQKILAVVEQCQLIEPEAKSLSAAQESSFAQPLQSLRHGLEQLQNVILEATTVAECIPALEAVAKPIQELEKFIAIKQSHEYTLQDSVKNVDYEIVTKLATPIQELASGIVVLEQQLLESGLKSFEEVLDRVKIVTAKTVTPREKVILEEQLVLDAEGNTLSVLTNPEEASFRTTTMKEMTGVQAVIVQQDEELKTLSILPAESAFINKSESEMTIEGGRAEAVLESVVREGKDFFGKPSEIEKTGVGRSETQIKEKNIMMDTSGKTEISQVQADIQNILSESEHRSLTPECTETLSEVESLSKYEDELISEAEIGLEQKMERESGKERKITTEKGEFDNTHLKMDTQLEKNKKDLDKDVKDHGGKEIKKQLDNSNKTKRENEESKEHIIGKRHTSTEVLDKNINKEKEATHNKQEEETEKKEEELTVRKKKEEEEAKKKKEEEEAKKKKEEEEAKKKREEEEVRQRKEEEEAKKKKEEEEAKKKNEEEEAKKKKEEEEAKKKNEEEEAKKKNEEEEAKKKKEEEEAKKKKEIEELAVKKKKEDEEAKKKEEDAQKKKEEEEAKRKKEEEEAKRKKEEEEAKRKKEEEELAAKKKKEDEEAKKKKEEEEAKRKKEEEDAKKRKEEEEAKRKKEEEDAKKKKEEEEAKKKREEDAKKKKKEEEELAIKKKKEEEEAKRKKEEEELAAKKKKEEEEAKKRKEEEEAKRKKEEEDAKKKKEEEEAKRKKEEEELAAKKKKEEEEAKKRKEEEDAKKKKEEEDAKKKKEEEEAKKRKEEEDAKKKKEEEDAKKKKEDEEAKKKKEEEDVKKKKEEEDVKKKKEEEDAKKKKEEEELAVKKKKEEEELAVRKKKEEEEAKRKKEEEDAKKKKEEEELAVKKKKEDEEAKKKKEEEDAKRKKVEEDAKKKKEEEELAIKKKKEEEELAIKKKKEEEEAKRKKEEEELAAKKKKEEEEAKRKKEEEDAKKKKEEEELAVKKKKEEEDAKKKKEEEELAVRKKKEEEEAKRKKEEEDAKKRKEEEEAKRKKEEEELAAKKKKEEEEAKRKKEEEDAKKKKEEEELAVKKKKEEEDAKKKKEEEELAVRKKKEEEEAKRKKEEEDAKKRKEEEEAKRKKEKEELAAKKKKEEEEAKKKKKEDEELAAKKKKEKDAKKKKEENEIAARKEEEVEAKEKNQVEVSDKKKDERDESKYEEDAESNVKKNEEEKEKEKEVTGATISIVESDTSKVEKDSDDLKKNKIGEEMVQQKIAAEAIQTIRKDDLVEDKDSAVLPEPISDEMSERKSIITEKLLPEEDVSERGKEKDKPKIDKRVKYKDEIVEEEMFQGRKATDIEPRRRRNNEGMKKTRDKLDTVLETETEAVAKEVSVKCRKYDNIDTGRRSDVTTDDKEGTHLHQSRDIDHRRSRVTFTRMESPGLTSGSYSHVGVSKKYAVREAEKSFKLEYDTTCGLGTEYRTKPRAETFFKKSQFQTLRRPDYGTSLIDLRNYEEKRKLHDVTRRELRRVTTKDYSVSLDDLSLKLAEYTGIKGREIPREKKGKPVVCSRLVDRTAPRGSTVKFTCTILGNPEPSIKWLRDGLPLIITPGDRYRARVQDGVASLEIDGATQLDNGEYTCLAENTHGDVTTTCKLKIFESYDPAPTPPTFIGTLTDTYRFTEDELILQCRVKSHPPPKVQWFRNGVPLRASSRYQQTESSDGICKLIIFNPEVDDSGDYTCRAENQVAEDSVTHRIKFQGRQYYAEARKVTSKTPKDFRKPHFRSELTDHLVPAGGTIALQVEVRGMPIPEVKWLRGNEELPRASSRVRSFEDAGVHTLIVSNATEKEAGVYSCHAYNAFGHIRTTAAVEVLPVTTVRGGKPPKIVNRPKDIMTANVEDDVIITCRVTGDPKPRVSWMKGTKDITITQRSMVEHSDDYYRFTLKKLVAADAGTYWIIAKNVHGHDRAFVTLQVKQRARSLTPGGFSSSRWDWSAPPSDSSEILSEIHDREKFTKRETPGPIASEPFVADSGRNWLTLSWNKPSNRGGAPVIGYRVDAWEMGQDGGARWTELGITPVNTFDVFNLKQGKEYKFRITPRNRYGWGEPLITSQPISVGYKTTNMPEFTKILPGQLKALKGSSIRLECQVSSDLHPQISWYRDGILIDFTSPRITSTFDGSVCRLLITDLVEEDSGRYMCEAVNKMGRVSSFARLMIVNDPKVWEADTKLRRGIYDEEGVQPDSPPQFTMRLRDRRVQMTYPVRLTCQVVGSPVLQVEWHHDGKLLIQDDRHSFTSEDHFYTLEMSKTTLEDAGSYTVTARNKHGSVSCRCNLVVDKGIRAYVAPEFVHELEVAKTVQCGEELFLTTQVEAYPSVGVVWHRNGVRLRPSRRIIMTLNHDGLVELAIASVTEKDSGVYNCTATNEVGRCETVCRVNVLPKKSGAVITSQIEEHGLPYCKAPMFIKKPRSNEAVEGDTVIIECQVVGDPKPEVYWLRDFLKPDYYRDAPNFRREGDGPDYRLEIPHAKIDYTGTYSVVARNVHGEVKAVTSLQIYAKGQGKEDKMDYRPVTHGKVDTLPVFTKGLKDIRCCDGDAVTLECEVEASKPPEVRWKKDGKLVRLGGDFSAEFDDGIAKLIINQVYPEDEGEYTCEASNELGKTATSACLVVDVPEEKENLLSRQLTRPPGLISGGSTPRSTPRTTPSRSISPFPAGYRYRSLSPGCRPRGLKVRPPKFYAVPHNRIAQEGETVRFQCAVAGHPAPWVTWDKDGVTVTPTARITIAEKDDLKILEISEITPEDAGLYRIVVENEVGRIEATARLDVIGPHSYKSKVQNVRAWSASPTFRRRLTGSIGRLGGNITLGCDIRSSPNPVTTWYRNGELIVRTNRITPTWNGETAMLEIENIEEGDAGVYTCMAENEFGRSHCSAEMVVLKNDPADQKAPIFTEPLKDTFTDEGNALELMVRIQGDGPLDVVWSKDNKKIPDCNDFRYVDYGDGRYGLRLTDAFIQDSGEYSCEVFNDFGDAMSSARLWVRDNSASAAPRIVFSKKPTSAVVVCGRSATFCSRLQNTGSDRIPVISWTVNGKNILENSSGKYLIEGDGHESILHIISVDHSDAGKITCSAVYNCPLCDTGECECRESAISCAAELTVLSENWASDSECDKFKCRDTRSRSLSTSEIEFDFPKMLKDSTRSTAVKENASRALLLRGPDDKNVFRGGRVVLCATYCGQPEPQVRWMKGGQQLKNGERISITAGEGATSLAIDRINCDDSGKYVVYVENGHGSDCHFASLAVEGPPEPPASYPLVNGLSPDSAQVEWSSPVFDGGCKITGYVIEMKANSESEWKVVSLVSNSLSHIIRNLSRGIKYKFRIRAENIHGRSEPSLESNELILPDHQHEISAQFEPRIVSIEDGDLFKDKYEVLEELGKGRFGVVHKVTDIETGEKLAAKFIRCITVKDREKVREEIEIMNCLRHPKLLQLAAAFESPREIVMVMEYISGGELFERVVADDFQLTERDCILFMRQICDGVRYMHENSVVHLDLKPENIMCQTRTSHEIKLIDFGLAQKIDPDNPVRVLFGTPEFVPPEVINYEPIGFESDMWSVGVICYVLLSGLSPFMGENDAETFANITRASYDFDEEAFSAISQDAKDFISSLLVKRKEKRLTASECLTNKWMLSEHDKTMGVILCTDKLKKFIIRRKWQKTGNAIRALGRLATLSAASRRNAVSNSPNSEAKIASYQIHDELNQRMDVCGNISSPLTKNPIDTTRTVTIEEEKSVFKSRIFSERSDSGISDCSSSSAGRSTGSVTQFTDKKSAKIIEKPSTEGNGSQNIASDKLDSAAIGSKVDVIRKKFANLSKNIDEMDKKLETVGKKLVDIGPGKLTQSNKPEVKRVPSLKDSKPDMKRLMQPTASSQAKVTSPKSPVMNRKENQLVLTVPVSPDLRTAKLSKIRQTIGVFENSQVNSYVSPTVKRKKPEGLKTISASERKTPIFARKLEVGKTQETPPSSRATCPSVKSGLHVPAKENSNIKAGSLNFEKAVAFWKR